MIVVTDSIKNNNNGSNNNSNSNNKYQVGLTIREEIMIQEATIYEATIWFICYIYLLSQQTVKKKWATTTF